MCGIIPKMSQESPSSATPCPYYSTGHCSKMKKNECPFSHNQKTCWIPRCKGGCGGRHPHSCDLFFTTGCFWRNCSYLHALPPPPPPPPPTLCEPPDQHPVLFMQEEHSHTKDQQIIEQGQFISNLKKQLSSQQDKILSLELKLSNLTDSLDEKMEKHTTKVSQLNTTFIQIDEKFSNLEAAVPKIDEVNKSLGPIAKLACSNNQDIRLLQAQVKENLKMVVEVALDVKQIRSAGCRALCPMQCAAPPPIPERNKHEEPATLHRLTSRD